MSPIQTTPPNNSSYIKIKLDNDNPPISDRNAISVLPELQSTIGEVITLNQPVQTQIFSDISPIKPNELLVFKKENSEQGAQQNSSSQQTGIVITHTCDHIKPKSSNVPKRGFPASQGTWKFKDDVLEVNGHKIKFLNHTGALAEHRFAPTHETVANALALEFLDEQVQNEFSRAVAQIEEITISPYTGPTNEHAHTDGKLIRFFSYNPGSDYTLQSYPRLLSQSTIAETTIHELGHVVEKMWFGKTGSNEWYYFVMKNPNLAESPSNHIADNGTEDFANSYKMYVANKGTPCEDTARAQYPVRFKYMEKFHDPIEREKLIKEMQNTLFKEIAHKTKTTF